MTFDSAEYPSQEFRFRFFANPLRDGGKGIAVVGVAFASSIGVAENCSSSCVMLYFDGMAGRVGVVNAAPFVGGSVNTNCSGGSFDL